MNGTRPPYPQPREDADNAAFLTSWRSGRVLLQRCDACGTIFFYPRPVCPQCWSEQLSGRESTGRGRIVSFSLVHRPNDPAFNDEVPIVLAEVALDEGATMLARIVDCDPAAVASGLQVEVPPDAAVRGYPLPVFRPLPAT
jgi:uncharacterized OB-fold protein